VECCKYFDGDGPQAITAKWQYPNEHQIIAKQMYTMHWKYRNTRHRQTFVRWRDFGVPNKWQHGCRDRSLRKFADRSGKKIGGWTGRKWENGKRQQRNGGWPKPNEK